MPRKKTNAEFLAEIKDRPFTALEPYTRANDKIRFKCDIDGNEWLAAPSGIQSGRGCPKCGIRINGENRRKTNAVLEDHGDWILVDISTPTHPDATMACDKDVFEAHTDGRIYAYKSTSRYIYATYNFINEAKATGSLFHRDVIEVPDGKDCDHIQHGTMSFVDNRRSNLRIVTRSQNLMNKSVRSDSKSGITGVSWCGYYDKWVAQIHIDGKRVFLGYFDIIELAQVARQQAEREYFGEYAPESNVN